MTDGSFFPGNDRDMHCHFSNFDSNPYSLRFLDVKLEEKFLHSFFDRFQTRWRIAHIISIVTPILGIVIYGWIFDTYEFDHHRYVLLAVTLLTTLIYGLSVIAGHFKVLWMSRSKWGRIMTYFFSFVPNFFITLMLFCSWSFAYCFDNAFFSPIPIVPIFSHTLIQPGFKPTLIFTFFAIISIVAIPMMNFKCFFLSDRTIWHWFARFISEVTMYIFTSLASIAYCYFSEKRERNSFILEVKISQKRESLLQITKTSKKLIQNVIPQLYVKKVQRFLLRRRKEKRQKIKVPASNFVEQSASIPPILCERQTNITILMVDFVDFTSYSERIAPKKLVAMLNVLYSTFDRHCEAWEVEKIKTIGDCHFSLLFDRTTAESRREDCVKMVNLSIAFLNSLKELNEKFDWAYHIRGGISQNSGNICVLGENQITFDVFGKAKIISEVLEATSKTNYIQVDSTVHKASAPQFDYSPAHTVTSKELTEDVTAYYLMSEVNVSQSPSVLRRIESKASVASSTISDTLTDEGTGSEQQNKKKATSTSLKMTLERIRNRLRNLNRLTIIERLLGTFIAEDPEKRWKKFVKFELRKFHGNRSNLFFIILFLLLFNLLIFAILVFLLFVDESYAGCFGQTKFMWDDILPINRPICLQRSTWADLFFWCAYAGLCATTFIIVSIIVMVLASMSTKRIKSRVVLMRYFFSTLILFIFVCICLELLIMLVSYYMSNYFTMFMSVTLAYIFSVIMSSYFIPIAVFLMNILFLLPSFLLFETNLTARALTLISCVMFFGLDLYSCGSMVAFSKLKENLKNEVYRLRKQKRTNQLLLLSFLPKSIVKSNAIDGEAATEGANKRTEEDLDTEENVGYEVLLGGEAEELRFSDHIGVAKSYLKTPPEDVQGYISFCRVEGFSEYFFSDVGIHEANSNSLRSRNMTAGRSLESIVFLNSLFTQFDRYCEKNQVVKIKNHNNLYLCVLWMNDERESPIEYCTRIAETALCFQRVFAQLIKWRASPVERKLSLRIGLHCGNMSTAVVGLTKFHFDIFGSSVNIASRICDQARGNSILFSEEVKSRLPRTFSFEMEGREGFEMKGVGKKRLYNLLGRSTK